MSEKMTCPGCDSHTSSVLNAFENGSACPVCGLSCEATEEILAVRDKKASNDLKTRVEELLKEKSKAEDESRLWQGKYATLKREVERGVRVAEAIQNRDPWQ
jgi:DNA repair exonuclease SbcCD ATPase subunit